MTNLHGVLSDLQKAPTNLDIEVPPGIPALQNLSSSQSCGADPVTLDLPQLPNFTVETPIDKNELGVQLKSGYDSGETGRGAYGEINLTIPFNGPNESSQADEIDS
jgi:hypothetical protein